MNPGLFPPPGSVELWTIDLEPDETTTGTFARHLDHEELARAARLHFAVHRMRFIVRRYAYRAILSRYVGCEPRDLKFATREYGKPTLSRPDIDYNATHSEAVAMLAVTGGSGVGLDIERVRDLGDQYEWLSEEERHRVLLLPPGDQATEALRMWTRKEAYVKALGVGITALDAALQVPPPYEPRPLRWTLVDLNPRPGYVASLAVQFDRPTIMQRNWTPTTALPADTAAR